MEKAESEEESLEKLLAELKDTSELMIDLAYSALLFQNKDLALSVLEMEEYIDELHTRFELKALKMGRGADDERGILGLIRLGVAAESISDAAADIAKIILREIPMHPVLQMVMQESEEVIEMAPVSEGSVLDGRSLGELGLEHQIGMRVIAVRSGHRWTYNPSPSFRLLAGDLMVAKGYSEGKEALRELASGKRREI